MQKFLLEIDATSENGTEITQRIKATINCSKEMGVGVIIHTLKSNPELRNMLLVAIEEYLDEMEQEKIKMN